MTGEALPLRTTATGVRLEVRLIPRASRTAIEGCRDGHLLVRVTAPPVDQAANEALVTALATVLDVPRRAVRIVTGATSRHKTVEVEGVTEATVRSRLDVR